MPELGDEIVQLRRIFDLLKTLRGSEAAIVQNYIITVMAETRAVLGHICLSDPPDRIVEWE